MDSPHKGPVTWKVCSCDDVIMASRHLVRDPFAPAVKTPQPRIPCKTILNEDNPWMFVINTTVKPPKARGLNSFRCKQNGCRFADDIFSYIPINWIYTIVIWYWLFVRLFKLTTKNYKLYTCTEESQVTGGFSAQMATNSESASMPWCHHYQIRIGWLAIWHRRHKTGGMSESLFYSLAPSSPSTKNCFINTTCCMSVSVNAVTPVKA